MNNGLLISPQLSYILPFISLVHPDLSFLWNGCGIAMNKKITTCRLHCGLRWIIKAPIACGRKSAK
jgi:hypothetical protein